MKDKCCCIITYKNQSWPNMQILVMQQYITNEARCGTEELTGFSSFQKFIEFGSLNSDKTVYGSLTFCDV